MQTQSTSSHIVKNQEERLPAPPGFESLPAFSLKRAETVDDPSVPMAVESPHDPEISSVPTSFDVDDTAAIKRSLKFEKRPWILHGQCQIEGESESKQHDMSFISRVCLPKGVVRGCPECSDCLKVSAGWDPEAACSYMLEEAPVFHPQEEEFKDTFKFIDSIRQQVEPYGLCCIIPPPSWQPPCFLEEDDMWHNYRFPTQVQLVNELQNHCSIEEASVARDKRDAKRRKLDYEFGDGCAANYISNDFHGEEGCQSAPGPQFTLLAFKRYADSFQQQYFSKDANASYSEDSLAMNHQRWEPSELNMEGEYWRIVEKPTEEIEVLSAADLDCRRFDWGIPSSTNSRQEPDSVEDHTSGWKLNHVSSLPRSLVSFEMLDSFSHFAPKLHVGMCFSSLPWTAEQLCLYKLHYLHLGAPRIWYGVAGSDSYKFEAIQRQYSTNPSKEHPELCSLGRQLSPATLKSQDISVYRCVQRPGEFVLFLPGAYHSGFDCGFNISASAVFAPLDWLPHGLTSVELYREQRRKTFISFDRMLLRAANEAVKAQWEYLLKGSKTPKIMIWKEASGKDGILAKVLRMRIRSEARCREYLSSASQTRNMDKSFGCGDQKRECSTCCYDLFLTAVSCPCNPNRFSCLKHTKNLCFCPWSDKIFLCRYSIGELEILVEAVEGKVSGIRRWVKDNLGMALYPDKPGKAETGPSQKPSDPARSNGRRTEPCEAVKASASTGDLKGKEVATATLGDCSDDSSSSSSSESDIEAYVARLEALKRAKVGPFGSDEVQSGLKPRKSGTQINSSVRAPVPANDMAQEKGNGSQTDIICLSDSGD